KEVAILSFGALLGEAMEAAEQLDATLINMRFIKPIDRKMIEKMARTHEHIITIEDNVIQGGAGSHVNEVLHQLKLHTPVLNLGLPDIFQDHGSREELLSEAGLTAEMMLQKINQFIKKTPNTKVFSL
ncbi:1-deoxy-D-xylulose 5-phosphate synthase, partial [hydrothermal vent metagenome]